ncbi:uncharacterized protein LOC110674465 [Aedes aegypti]|uniref:Uncharacterized protein n=1 Tax=Aedes aegypti TaxID=7159 RepID=A0A6I8U5R0_AEDAE|nr:uncharacterized protein LOC110674465 [Aedes aegypti]
MKPVLVCTIVIFNIVLSVSSAEVYSIANQKGDYVRKEAIKADLPGVESVKVLKPGFPTTGSNSQNKEIGNINTIIKMPMISKTVLQPGGNMGARNSSGTIKGIIGRLTKPLQCFGSQPAVPLVDATGPLEGDGDSKFIKLPMRPVVISDAPKPSN